MISDFFQQHKTTFTIAGVVFALFVGGMLFAFFLPSKNSSEDIPTGNTTNTNPLFSDLRIGTPVRASFATQKNPPIKQKSEYTVKELIMLRGTTTAAATSPVTLNVRLADSQSRIISLNPSSITLEPGTNSYCCWTIDTPGDYTMQIFRPDSIVTRIPIKMTKDFESSVPK